jgi:hypothetical protein
MLLSSFIDTIHHPITSLTLLIIIELNEMKVTIVVLVWAALLLHDASVEGFQQSSTGYLNTLTWALPKSMPVQGYLDSLGNTATALKDKASSAYLPPTYEAEYPRRHDFSNVAVYPSPSQPAASTVQQSELVSKQASSKVSTGTGTGGTSIYQYGQRTCPSELSGNAYMNMMGAAGLATSGPSAKIEPEPSIIKEVTAAKDTTTGKETAANPREAVFMETKIVGAPKLPTNVAPSGIIKPAETPFKEKKVETSETVTDVSSQKPMPRSMSFTGYLDSLARMWSTAIEEAPTLVTNVAPPEIIIPVETPSTAKKAEMFADASLEKSMTMSMSSTGYLDTLAKMWSTADVSVPTSAEMAGAPTATTVDTPKPVWLAEPKPESSSTAFGGYIGSLTKESSQVVAPATAKIPAAPTSTKTVQATPKTSNDTTASRLDTVELQSDESSTKPKAVSTSFGGYLSSLTKSSDKASGLESPVSPGAGYLGSLNQKSSEDEVPGEPVVGSSQTKMDNGGESAKQKATPTSLSGYLDSLMTQKSPEDDFPGEPVVASSHTRMGDGADAHSAFFAPEKIQDTEEKLAPKIDFAPRTPSPRPTLPLDGNEPAYSEVVEDDDLPSWVKAFMTAEDDASIGKAAFVEKTAPTRHLARERPTTTKTGGMKAAKDIWETASPMMINGGSLRTWSEPTSSVERVQVSMKTEGLPLHANVELWHGPDNTPLKIAIYSDDGGLRPFNAVLETPAGQNTVAIRNTGQMEFPLAACVGTDVEDVAKRLSDMGTLKTIQGGAIQTYPFDHSVASVQVLLMTGGRPLNARIELLQGPNNDKQVINISTEDGMLRPFFIVIETPGTGNVVRVVNTAAAEFPMTACVQPYLVEPGTSDESGRRGWDNGGTSSFRPDRERAKKYQSRKGIFE